MNLSKLKAPDYSDAIHDWLEFEKMIVLLRNKLKDEQEITFENIQDAFAEISGNNEVMVDSIQKFFLEFVKVNVK